MDDSLHNFVLANSSRSPGYDALEARVFAVWDTVSATLAEGKTQIRLLLLEATFRETGTGMNAHYVFSNVPAGRYTLFGEWKIGDGEYQWWSHIELRAGQQLTKDLDNDAEANNQLFCGIT